MPMGFLSDIAEAQTAKNQGPSRGIAKKIENNIPDHLFLAGGKIDMRFLLCKISFTVSLCVACQTMSSITTANTIAAAKPSSIDIQSAIDAASDGDTVRVAAGNATWTSNVTIPSTKGIKLIGAGKGKTVCNLAGKHNIFLDTRSTNSPVRVSGFTFTNSPGRALKINARTIGAADWRIDHCEWKGRSGKEAVVYIEGYTFGVIDNCNFINTNRTFCVDGQTRPFDTTGSPMPYPGGYSWQQSIGGASAVYIEDCTFNNSSSSILGNTGAGARLVFRHNTVSGPTGIETHSGCTNGFRNPRWIEVYENNFNATSGYWCGLFLRSINGMIFNNTFSSSYQQSIRFDSETICGSGCNAGWSTSNKTVYPAQDQIGAGIDTGWNTPQSTNEAKLRIWNNLRGAGPAATNIGGCADSLKLVQHDRDYFLQVAPFNGSSGIGVGFLSARPSSGLTIGRYYWATDTNTLYRSTSSTTWEAHYTPFTYPHPLRNY